MSDSVCHLGLRNFWLRLTEQICSGFPLLRSLRNIERQFPGDPLSEVARAVADDVEKGSRLSEAMRKHPAWFGKAAVCFIEGGEYAGVLERALLLILEHVWRCPTCTAWQPPAPTENQRPTENL